MWPGTCSVATGWPTAIGLRASCGRWASSRSRWSSCVTPSRSFAGQHDATRATPSTPARSLSGGRRSHPSRGRVTRMGLDGSLDKRLTALYEDLGNLPAEAPCPWPVARVFNTLLAETRTVLPEDPVVLAIGSLRVSDKQQTMTTTPYGAVRTLVRQLSVAMDGQSPASS